MWRAVPFGWLGRRYRIEESGRLVGSVDLGGWAEQGSIEIDGRLMPIRREGFWNRRYFLRRDNEDIASSQSAGAFRRGFYIVHGDDEYRVDPSSFFNRSFALTQRGRSRGEIRSVGLFFKCTTRIELDGDLAPELRLFVFWLVMSARRRAAAAAAAS